MSEHVLPPARHETRDIGFRPMLIAAILMVLALTLVALFAFWLFPHSTTDKFIAGPVPRFPSPALQTSPADDMARFYAGEMQRLNGTGWIDRAHGIAHIPIEDAMRRIAASGIPDWPKEPAR